MRDDNYHRHQDFIQSLLTGELDLAFTWTEMAMIEASAVERESLKSKATEAMITVRYLCSRVDDSCVRHSLQIRVAELSHALAAL